MTYAVIYADPPWPLKIIKRKARPKQVKMPYPTLSFAEIKTILKNARDKAPQSHSLMLWCIDKYLPQSEEIAKELGYKKHTRMIWDKTNGFPACYTVRFSHEYLGWWYHGKFERMRREEMGKWRTVFQEKSTAHSKKPEIAYKMIESWWPDAHKLELFARNKREGWDCWGNEVESTVTLD